MPHQDFNHHTMHYQDVGSGPVILFGHSYLWNNQMWRPQIAALSQHYRCIVPDLWDHGDTGHLPPYVNSIHDLAECYHQLMQTLGIAKYAVVGLSVGGMWAADLALNHPNNVTALVLMDTFLGEEPKKTQLIYFALLDSIEINHFIDPIVNNLIPYFFSPKTLKANHPIVAEFKQMLQKTSPENITGIVKLGKIIFNRISLLPHFNQLTVPVQILVGIDDIPRPPKESAQMAELIPDAQLVIIENAGHISTLENPQAVTAHLTTFLNNSLGNNTG